MATVLWEASGLLLLRAAWEKQTESAAEDTAVDVESPLLGAFYTSGQNQTFHHPNAL